MSDKGLAYRIHFLKSSTQPSNKTKIEHWALKRTNTFTFLALDNFLLQQTGMTRVSWLSTVLGMTLNAGAEMDHLDCLPPKFRDEHRGGKAKNISQVMRRAIKCHLLSLTRPLKPRPHWSCQGSAQDGTCHHPVREGERAWEAFLSLGNFRLSVEEGEGEVIVFSDSVCMLTGWFGSTKRVRSKKITDMKVGLGTCREE